MYIEKLQTSIGKKEEKKYEYNEYQKFNFFLIQNEQYIYCLLKNGFLEKLKHKIIKKR